MSGDGFLSRWSRRKEQVQRGEAPVEELPQPQAPTTPEMALPVAEPPALAPPPDPPPTLEDAARLTPQSADFSRFVRADVAPEVRHSALKTLFADPHFNVMDGLDTYIDDYSKPDPLPPSMLRQMAQSQILGLFDAEPEPPAPVPDEDPDLRLQPDDAAGRAEPEPGTGEDAGREP